MFIIATVDLSKGRELENINKLKQIDNYANEIVLVEIKAYNNGSIQVSPAMTTTIEEKSNNNHVKSKNLSSTQQLLKETDAMLDLETLQSQWYTFIAPKSKIKYWYKVENISHPPQELQNHHRKELINHKIQTILKADGRKDYKINKINTNFIKSPDIPGNLRLNCFGQIDKAIGFNEDNLYIEYELYFNNRWHFDTSDRYQILRSSTHISSTKLQNNTFNFIAQDSLLGTHVTSNNMLQANFNFPFQFELQGREGHIHTLEELIANGMINDQVTDKKDVVADANLGHKRTARNLKEALDTSRYYDEDDEIYQNIKKELKEYDPPISYPIMYFQVNSIDHWNRHRVVGYGYCNIPNEAGTHTIEVKTWVPIGSISAEMKKYFIGGTPSLKDIKLSGIPLTINTLNNVMNQDHTSKRSFVNKVGWKSENSGSIFITMNCIYTRHNPIHHKTTAKD